MVSILSIVLTLVVVGVLGIWLTAGRIRAIEVRAGDVFVKPEEEGGYRVVKVLKLDELVPAYHICVYGDTLRTIPKSIDTSKLHPFIMHLPVAREMLWSGSPVLVQNEAVQEHELEGYKMYLEAMNRTPGTTRDIFREQR